MICRPQRAITNFRLFLIAHGDGRHARFLKSIERTQLLILDDWGLSVLTQNERCYLLEILEIDKDARQQLLQVKFQSISGTT